MWFFYHQTISSQLHANKTVKRQLISTRIDFFITYIREIANVDIKTKDSSPELSSIRSGDVSVVSPPFPNSNTTCKSETFKTPMNSWSISFSQNLIIEKCQLVHQVL